MIVQVDFFVLSLCEKDIELFNSPSWLKFDFSLCQTFFFYPVTDLDCRTGRSSTNKLRLNNSHASVIFFSAHMQIGYPSDSKTMVQVLQMVHGVPSCTCVNPRDFT